MGNRPRCDTDLHQLVRRRARSRGAADLRQRRVGARSDAGRPRLRQDESLERRAVHAARRQHEHGRRAISRMGRAALGAQRQPVEPSHHRAVHRRMLQQRAWQLRRGARTGTYAENLGLPEPRRSGRPDARRSAYRRLVSDQQRQQCGQSRCVHGAVELEQHLRRHDAVTELHRIGTVSTFDELAREPSELWDSDGVSAADQHADGRQSGAEHAPWTEKHQHGHEPLSGGGLQHQQRGAQSRRDHRQRRA